MEAERERLEAERERLEKEEKRRIEEERLRAENRRLKLRKNFVNNLSAYDYDWPVSSSTLSSEIIYYYVTAYPTNGLANNITYTNIFSIAKRDDDSWPYYSDIINDLKKKAGWQKFNMQVHGYFSSKYAADKHRNSFKKQGKLNDFKLTLFYYQIIDSGAGSTSAFDDPWNKTKTQDKTQKKETNADEKFDDPWGTSTNTKKKKN